MTNINFSKDFISGWRIWIALVFLLIPGAIYQFDFSGVSFSDIENWSILILFLIRSLYYSFPFWLVGIFGFMSMVILSRKNYKGKKIGWVEILIVSLYGIAFYWLNFTAINLYNINFWNAYTIIILPASILSPIFLSLIILIPKIMLAILNKFKQPFPLYKNDNRKS